MPVKNLRFTYQNVQLHLASSFSKLKELADPRSAIFLTDENVLAAHPKKFKDRKVIVIPAGEAHKVQATVDSVISQMIALEADRNSFLIGVGGGVVTDLAGYIGSIYMRGIRFGFVPTTVLSLVDASIGGKSGIDVGAYKNMIGVIRQPNFILQDLSLLSTLPDQEWVNGFAEIVKHAAIRDAKMFAELEKRDLGFYRKKKKETEALIGRNALLKASVVLKDEFETGDRKLLNFGHTLGHALENQYDLSHGQAISIGMTYACALSAVRTGFRHTDRLVHLLERYGLPTHMAFDRDRVIDVLKMDKKRQLDSIRFVLLERIGKARLEQISIAELYEML